MHHHHDATHMNSSEGEKVEFKQVVKLEGVVEGWLCDVEAMMKVTLKDILRACRVDLKKNLSRRDKWVRDWPGQVLITASQIQWTADCEKALDRKDKKGLKTLKKKQVRNIGQCTMFVLTFYRHEYFFTNIFFHCCLLESNAGQVLGVYQREFD